MHEAERERLQDNIDQHRSDLRRALRDVGISVVLGLNLPRRIRRRPLPWALAAAGVVAFVIVRRQRSAKQRKRWWEGRGAQG